MTTKADVDLNSSFPLYLQRKEACWVLLTARRPDSDFQLSFSPLSPLMYSKNGCLLKPNLTKLKYFLVVTGNCSFFEGRSYKKIKQANACLDDTLTKPCKRATDH